MIDQFLEIDESFYPQGNLFWTGELSKLIAEFVKGFSSHSDEKNTVWLKNLMKVHLPQMEKDDIDAFIHDVEYSLNVAEEKKSSLAKAMSNGRAKENWFAAEMRKVISKLPTENAVQYMESVDSALRNANAKLYDSLKTKSGLVNMNPKLDGFIAEQYHAGTFNMNATAAGSKYRAEVLMPEGKTFAKNSVDIVVKDSTTGKVVQRYQSKYCKNPTATQSAIDKGDYVGQQYLVAEGQSNSVRSKASETIVAPDGVSSNSLPKSRAEQMRDEAQSGSWNDLNWNEYKTKDLLVGVGKLACMAGLQSAAIGAGLKVVENLIKDGEVHGDEVVEAALETGADATVKCAAAGALKVAVEKGIVDFIPKGTPASTVANMAFMAVENVKTLSKVATGEMDVRQGIDAVECTTVSCVAGLAASSATAEACAAGLGSVFGPAGAAVGAVVGGTVGYVGGSVLGETYVKGAQKVRDLVFEGVKTAAKTAVNVATKVWDVASEAWNGLKSLLPW